MIARPEVSLHGGDLRVADELDSHQAASAVLTEDFEEVGRMISLSRGAPPKKLRLTEQPAAVRFDLDLEADPADGDATRIVHPSLQGVRSPDCGGRADRGRGRGDCRRARRGRASYSPASRRAWKSR